MTQVLNSSFENSVLQFEYFFLPNVGFRILKLKLSYLSLRQTDAFKYYTQLTSLHFIAIQQVITIHFVSIPRKPL